MKFRNTFYTHACSWEIGQYTPQENMPKRIPPFSWVWHTFHAGGLPSRWAPRRPKTRTHYGVVHEEQIVNAKHPETNSCPSQWEWLHHYDRLYHDWGWCPDNDAQTIPACLFVQGFYLTGAEPIHLVNGLLCQAGRGQRWRSSKTSLTFLPFSRGFFTFVQLQRNAFLMY